MKYLCLIYNDPSLLNGLPSEATEAMMRECNAYADELRAEGHLLASQGLAPAAAATTLRVRNGTVCTTDGPFAETREQLGGFNLIEARDLNEAIRLALRFPWARTGSIEIRPVRD